MKKNRHDEILSLIERESIETQDELADKLRKAGYSVTQATVSRDIRELNLTKAMGENGKQKYIAIIAKGQAHSSRHERVIRESVVSADCAGNLLVIKTLTGMGMAVAVNLDEMKHSEIIGTIAGDDVVFCAVKTVEDAQRLKEYYISIIL